jgi:hypothetical protein
VERFRKCWWRFVYLLGLDAPLVAVLWLFLFAKTWRVNYHPWEAYVSLGLIVWTVRIVSKILHGSVAGDQSAFEHIHRKWLSRIAVIAGICAVVLTILNFPLSIYNYLMVGALLVLGYFGVSLFSSAEEGRVSYLKHTLAGAAFAFGTALMAHAYLPSLDIREMAKSRELICFAVLCLIASTAAEVWSNTKRSEDNESAFQDELLLSLPLTLLGAASLVFAVQAETMAARPFFYGILTGAALLQVLNRTHYRFSVVDIKVLASSCLLVPGIIFQAYEMSR